MKDSFVKLLKPFSTLIFAICSFHLTSSLRDSWLLFGFWEHKQFFSNSHLLNFYQNYLNVSQSLCLLFSLKVPNISSWSLYNLSIYGLFIEIDNSTIIILWKIWFIWWYFLMGLIFFMAGCCLEKELWIKSWECVLVDGEN